MTTKPVRSRSAFHESPIDQSESVKSKTSLRLKLISCALVMLLALPGVSAQQQDEYKKARKRIMKATVEMTPFGKLDDGTEIQMYTLRNSAGASVKIITYGATLAELWVPDRNGQLSDVVLGFDNLKGYLG